VRTALEKRGIGWCMWDYAGGFAVATGEPGKRVADPETVKALGLAPPEKAEGKTEGNSQGNAQGASAEAPKSPTIEITLDTSEAPDMAGWAARARELCLESYPMILSHLRVEGHDPPARARIVFKDMRGVAGTSGGTITCGVGWFKGHPDDYGAVIHELCHVVQDYGRQRIPGWVTEGIADWVRWFNYEPADRRPRVNPRRAKYTDSYQTTAAFFDWIVRTKDKTFVSRLNAACRGGEYKPRLFEEYAGKTVDDLWAEFIASLAAKSARV